MLLKLDPDELGKIGESHFEGICAKAKLTCNKSDWDKTGWDYIVEFPFAPASTVVSLDSRKAPISCHVQVKTLTGKGNRVSMALTSAERIAKEPKPSFFYIARANKKHEIVEAYIIHVLDKPLAKILKRLRKEQAKGNSARLRDLKFSLTEKDGVKIDPTGDALKLFIEQACGADMQGYMVAKANQLAKLGYEARPFELSVTLHLKDSDELVDAFLGLKKEVAATNINSYETRFAIRLPQLGPNQEGKITIQPRAFDSCVVVVRTTASSFPAVFKGEVFAAPIPNLPFEKQKFLIKTDCFQITIRKGTWEFESPPQLVARGPSEWAAYWALVYALSTGAGSIEIRAHKLTNSITVPVTERVTAFDPDISKSYLYVSEAAAELLKRAGVAPEPMIAFDVLWPEARAISEAIAVVRGEADARKLTFETDRPDTDLDLSSMRMLWVNFADVGALKLGYYAIAEVEVEKTGDKLRWQGTSFSFQSVDALGGGDDPHKEYIENVQQRTGIAGVIYRSVPPE